MPEIDSKTVLVTIAGEFFQNIFFYGIGAVAIVAISIYISWWFAFILFLGFTTVVVFSVLQQVLVLGTNALYLYSRRRLPANASRIPRYVDGAASHTCRALI